MKDQDHIQKMFGSIATSYDKTNTIMSLGLHKRWNALLIDEINRSSPSTLLDLCAGTGEIALPFLEKNQKAEAILLDFSPEMLAIADAKGASCRSRFKTQVGDATSLNLPTGSVDAISCAYGIRNIQNPLLCFREAKRVLKEGGTFGILELTRPKNPFLHLLHKLYLSFFLPLVGKITSKNGDAYKYLSKSILSFSSPEELERDLKKLGFLPQKKIRLLGGIATVLIVKKQKEEDSLDKSSLACKD